jgi:hydroxymethylpyrimidine/phosphomethylpyrimidine kinase
MAQAHTSPTDPEASGLEDEDSAPACVMSFNASDPSGAGGLTADVLAISSAGAHALAVVTGAYSRDTAEILDHFPFDEDAVSEQARAALEDMPVSAIKVGFVGSPENVSAIAEIASDYADVPLIAYMPNLSWWDDSELESYLDAFRELMLPQATVLVGNHSTLWRWLLPDWSGEGKPASWVCLTPWSPACQQPTSRLTTCWPHRKAFCTAKNSNVSRPVLRAPATPSAPPCPRCWPTATTCKAPPPKPSPTWTRA